MSAIEAGALASAHGDVERGSWEPPEPRGESYAQGWADGVAAVSEGLVRTADRRFQQRGRAAASARLQAGKPAPDGAGELERLRAFARQAVHRTHPHTMERRRVLELLGEDGQLCNARTIEYSTGDVIWCTREAGHYDPEVRPEDGDPGGWHLCNGRRWMDDRPYNHPHKSV
ncbi:hypothetical protein AB0G32_36670 [Streptomyces sp. NPDC023723]|uniref:hypothetical protein n=1 Tax=Streptomyces sp. NPDC023723 TaxID=3154323 RepID=UPI0033F289B3